LNDVLENKVKDIERRSRTASIPTTAGSGSPSRAITREEELIAEQRADERNWIAVDEELDGYVREGLVSGDEVEDFNLERCWQVCFAIVSLNLLLTWTVIFIIQANRYRRPIMFLVAPDILPVQASCDRVFIQQGDHHEMQSVLTCSHGSLASAEVYLQARMT
jgi:hypothetical protein